MTHHQCYRREELQQLAGLNNRLAFLVDKVRYYHDDEGDDDGDHCGDGDGHWNDNDGTDNKEDHILY